MLLCNTTQTTEHDSTEATLYTFTSLEICDTVVLAVTQFETNSNWLQKLLLKLSKNESYFSVILI